MFNGINDIQRVQERQNNLFQSFIHESLNILNVYSHLGFSLLNCEINW